MDYPKIINVLAQTAAQDRVSQLDLTDIEDAGVKVLPTLVALGHGDTEVDVMRQAAKGNLHHQQLIMAVNTNIMTRP